VRHFYHTIFLASLRSMNVGTQAHAYGSVCSARDLRGKQRGSSAIGVARRIGATASTAASSGLHD
jgi:hypothetical protein